jgi:osmotically-inducible protein OsmY
VFDIEALSCVNAARNAPARCAGGRAEVRRICARGPARVRGLRQRRKHRPRSRVVRAMQSALRMTTASKTDSDLQKSVIEALASDPTVDEASIGVSVHHGVVTLNGAVASWTQKRAAEDAAHQVAGVLDVANDIEIKPPWSARKTDADIAEAVRHALQADGFAAERRIQSTVTDAGHVTLAGAVATLQQRDDAERLVASLDGVRLVTNQLVVEGPRTRPDDLRSSIKEALERHVAREADRIAIEIDGQSVVLSGRVASWRERQAVIGAAKGTPGVQRIEDRLVIATS